MTSPSSTETLTSTDDNPLTGCAASDWEEWPLTSKVQIPPDEDDARRAHTRALRGKYRHVLSSSSVLSAQKSAEKMLE